jgi:hypothetical protein
MRILESFWSSPRPVAIEVFIDYLGLGHHNEDHRFFFQIFFRLWIWFCTVKTTVRTCPRSHRRQPPLSLLSSTLITI